MGKMKILLAHLLFIVSFFVLRPHTLFAENCTNEQNAEFWTTHQAACDADCNTPGCQFGTTYCINFNCNMDPGTGCYTGCGGTGCAACSGECYQEGENCQSDADCCGTLVCNWPGSCGRPMD